MKTRFNPANSSKELGWVMMMLDEDDLSYEFNFLAFWKTPNGVFTAEDRGCSCPTPFEEYEGSTSEEIESKLEKVGSLAQAESIIRSWNKKPHAYSDTRDIKTCVPAEEVMKALQMLRSWDLQ